MLKKILIAIAFIVLVVIGIIVNSSNSNNNIVKANTEQIVSNKNAYTIVVEIKGEVKVPGVYTMNSDSRVYDLINKAGGFTEYANKDNIKLASYLNDGDSVHVLRKEEEKREENKKININESTLSELMTLPGIGEAKAKAIISYREENGSFNSIYDLTKVKGISEGILSNIINDITV